MNFENLNLHPDIIAGVRELGYTELTPIQGKAIPHILEGRDVIGLAQTGTGKTAAFALPILQRLQDGKRRQVKAAVIAPTRELAEQTNDAINKLGKRTGLQSIALYGGTNINRQIQDLQAGVEIVVACPGRLLDHLWRGTVDLSNLDMLVIDEADRMFDMGFLPDVRKIIQCLTKPRQTLLFSATMPKEISKLAHEITNSPVTVQVDRIKPAASVSHSLYPVAQHLKAALLTEILYRTDCESVIVFTRTKHRAETIVRKLKRDGFRAASLQGNLSQSRRQAAMDGFRSGRVQILVATDIASRGLDILRISHVINYDMPGDTDTYIHRIGRTGRVNNNGEALTFVTNGDKSMVDALEKLLGAPIERRTLEGFDYSRANPNADSGNKGARGTRRRPSFKAKPAMAGRAG